MKLHFAKRPARDESWRARQGWIAAACVAVLVGALSVVGCADPLFHLHTFGDISVNAAIAPNPKQTPVFASLLPHRPHFPRACRVAVIDVDGVLLDSDATGLGSLGENPVALFRERLDAVEHDHCVRAVGLRIHPPGGRGSIRGTAPPSTVASSRPARRSACGSSTRSATSTTPCTLPTAWPASI